MMCSSSKILAVVSADLFSRMASIRLSMPVMFASICRTWVSSLIKCPLSKPPEQVPVLAALAPHGFRQVVVLALIQHLGAEYAKLALIAFHSLAPSSGHGNPKSLRLILHCGTPSFQNTIPSMQWLRRKSRIPSKVRSTWIICVPCLTRVSFFRP